jgi:hypothetical protein
MITPSKIPLPSRCSLQGSVSTGYRGFSHRLPNGEQGDFSPPDDDVRASNLFMADGNLRSHEAPQNGDGEMSHGPIS